MQIKDLWQFVNFTFLFTVFGCDVSYVNSAGSLISRETITVLIAFLLFLSLSTHLHHADAHCTLLYTCLPYCTYTLGTVGSRIVHTLVTVGSHIVGLPYCTYIS